MSLFKKKKRRLSFAGLVLVSFSIMAAFSIFLHDHEFDPLSTDDFSIMAAFSIFLHDHEFDPLSTDEDCAPCQWTQINVDVNSDVPTINFIPVTFSNDVEIGIPHYKNFKHTYFGLSPPNVS